MESQAFHHGNLRAALIDAGTALLESDGPHALSMRELARRVGVTPMAAYRHFADKDALVTAIAESGFRALAEASHVAMPPGSDAHLLAMARVYLDFAVARPAMFGLMFAEPLDMGRVAAMSDAASDAYRPIRDAVAAALGPRADEDKVMVGVIRLWSAVHGYAALRLSNRLPRAATVRDRFDEVMEAVIASLR
jgi:AcrR family transcriptional regulator